MRLLKASGFCEKQLSIESKFNYLSMHTYTHIQTQTHNIFKIQPLNEYLNFEKRGLNITK